MKNQMDQVRLLPVCGQMSSRDVDLHIGTGGCGDTGCALASSHPQSLLLSAHAYVGACLYVCSWFPHWDELEMRFASFRSLMSAVELVCITALLCAFATLSLVESSVDAGPWVPCILFRPPESG